MRRSLQLLRPRSTAHSHSIHPHSLTRASLRGGAKVVSKEGTTHETPSASLLSSLGSHRPGAPPEKKRECSRGAFAASAVYPLLPPPPSHHIRINHLDDHVLVAPLRTREGESNHNEKKKEEENAAAAPDAVMKKVTGRQLWVASRLARGDRNIRRAHGVCVVGGWENIHKIWHQYGIRPHVVYVPEEGEEREWGLSSSSPSYQLKEKSSRSSCVGTSESMTAKARRTPLSKKQTFLASLVSSHSGARDSAAHDTPTYVVQAPSVDIQRHLLSATLSDPYAAEFPWNPNTQLLPLSSALPHHLPGEAGQGCDTAEASPQEAKDVGEVSRITSMLVLVGLRIPTNLGTLLSTAEAMGFSSVALVDCVDPFNEKVIRAAGGAPLSPHLQLYEYSGHEAKSSLVALLSHIAAAYSLLPLLAVPSQEAESGFEVAKRLHAHNLRFASGDEPRIARNTMDASGETPHNNDKEEEEDSALPSILSAFSKPVGPMLVLGAESSGLAALADTEWSVPFQSVTVPLPNTFVDSFNVAVAGAILMDMFRPTAASPFRRILELHKQAPHGETEEKVEVSSDKKL